MHAGQVDSQDLKKTKPPKQLGGNQIRRNNSPMYCTGEKAKFEIKEPGEAATTEAKQHVPELEEDKEQPAQSERIVQLEMKVRDLTAGEERLG